MDVVNFKSILIAAIIFIPLERAFAVRPNQKIFGPAGSMIYSTWWLMDFSSNLASPVSLS